MGLVPLGNGCRSSAVEGECEGGGGGGGGEPTWGWSVSVAERCVMNGIIKSTTRHNRHGTVEGRS